MERVIARKLATSRMDELTKDELKLVSGGEQADYDCVTEAGYCDLAGGGKLMDPRRIDCA